MENYLLHDNLNTMCRELYKDGELIKSVPREILDGGIPGPPFPLVFIQDMRWGSMNRTPVKIKSLSQFKGD